MLCASTRQGSAVGGAWKVLLSSLPAGTCGQEQRRRSEAARDKWWGIPSRQEGLLVSTEQAGVEDPGATRSPWSLRPPALAGWGVGRQPVGCWEDRLHEWVGGHRLETDRGDCPGSSLGPP